LAGTDNRTSQTTTKCNVVETQNGLGNIELTAKRKWGTATLRQAGYLHESKPFVLVQKSGLSE